MSELGNQNLRRRSAVLSNAKKESLDWLLQANRQIQKQIAGPSDIALSERHAGNLIKKLIRAAYNQHNEAVDQAYRKAAPYHKLRLKSKAAQAIFRKRLEPLVLHLQLSKHKLNLTYTPVSFKIRLKVEHALRQPHFSDPLERTRRDINEAINAIVMDLPFNELDFRVAIELREIFDQTVEQCIRAGHVRHVSQTEANAWLDAVREARKRSRILSELFVPHYENDIQRQVLNRIVTQNLTGEGVANLLVGKPPLANDETVVTILKHVQTTLADKPQIFFLLRQLIWLRLSGVTKDRDVQVTTTNAMAQAKRIQETFRSHPKTMALLFSEEELKLFRQFAEQLVGREADQTEPASDGLDDHQD